MNCEQNICNIINCHSNKISSLTSEVKILEDRVDTLLSDLCPVIIGQNSDGPDCSIVIGCDAKGSNESVVVGNNATSGGNSMNLKKQVELHLEWILFQTMKIVFRLVVLVKPMEKIVFRLVMTQKQMMSEVLQLVK